MTKKVIQQSHIFFWLQARLILSLFLLLSVLNSHAQTTTQKLETELKTTNDVARKLNLLPQLVQAYYQEGKLETANKYAEEGLQLARTQQDAKAEGLSIYWIAKVSQQKKQYNTALNQYLEALALAEKQDNLQLSKDIYQNMGDLYLAQSAYEKAISNYQTALEVKVPKEGKAKTILLESLAFAQLQHRQYKESISNYQKSLEIHTQNKELKAQNRILEKLSEVSLLDGNLQEALKYNQKIVELNKILSDGVSLASSLNNLGYIYRELGDEKNALKYMKQALELNSKFDVANRNQELRKRDALYAINLGVTYSNLKEYKNARKNFEDAQKIYLAQNNERGIAKTYNFIAANDYASGRNESAVRQINQAIEIGERLKDDEILKTSYWLLSEINRKNSNFQSAQQYYAKFQESNQRLKEKERQQEQFLLQNQINIEKTEGEIKILLAEKERQALALKQSELEREKQVQDLKLKENELALLKRNQELQVAALRNQQLEKDRVEQLLQITREQARSEKQKREIQQLESSKRIQDLALKQKTAQEKEKQRAIELLNKNQELKDLQLKEAENLQQNRLLAGIAVFAFLAIIIFLIGVNAVRNRRKNRQLAQQAKELEIFNKRLQSNEQILQKANDRLKKREREIKEKNEELQASEEELRQNMEELEANKEEIETQKEALQFAYLKIEEKNNAFMQSVKYAEKIQQAILPNQLQLRKNFADHFVIYLPKDVVSGDFFWFTKLGNKNFVACVDCTGHGVPGAFMSLIGSSLLNQIVNEQKIAEPHHILENLHSSVVKALKQRETSNIDGMDLSICAFETWEDNQITLEFSGAKSSVYYLREGELHELKGDRKAIGGSQNDKILNFTLQRVTLHKGDLVYMTTDGFEDAPNPKRKKFGTKRIKQLLLENSQQPLNKQKDVLLEALHTHHSGTLQRDDITFIGLKI